MVIDLFADNAKPYKYEKELINEVQSICRQMDNAVSQFNFATDSQELEAIIYRLKALEVQYSVLIKRAKLNKNCYIRTVATSKR